MILPRMTIVVLALALVAACGSRDRDVTLTRIKHTGDGPDEFSILPGKPLQEPEDYASLPAPAPGGTNRTDQTPRADGIVALGGNPDALSGGVRASETALLGHVRRHGSQSDIRRTLAAEDQEVRRRHGRVNIFNLGPNDDYTNAYRRQWLDSSQEQERLRRRGVLTPAAPPGND